MEKYADRYDAGKFLATYLEQYTRNKDAIILALPRGGVPVAYELAKILSLPMDVFIVRKLGVPDHEELAMGAVASGGVIVFNDRIIRDLAISQLDINRVIESEKKEIERREEKYRGSRLFPDLTNKIVILVDDGIATGATIRAAIKSLRSKNIKKLIIAVPVASEETCRELVPLVDELVCPLMPQYFNAVGSWFEDFGQTSDSEVADLMKKL